MLVKWDTGLLFGVGCLQRIWFEFHLQYQKYSDKESDKTIPANDTANQFTNTVANYTCRTPNTITIPYNKTNQMD